MLWIKKSTHFKFENTTNPFNLYIKDIYLSVFYIILNKLIDQFI